MEKSKSVFCLPAGWPTENVIPYPLYSLNHKEELQPKTENPFNLTEIGQQSFLFKCVSGAVTGWKFQHKQESKVQS